MKRKGYLNILVLFFIYSILNLIVFFKEGDFLYLMLSFNVFLSILPIIFIDRVDMDRFAFKDIIFTLLWLFFFPNAMYMITDFIHIAGLDYRYIVGDNIYNRSIVYSKDIIIWIRLLLIGFGFMFSTSMGLESLYTFYNMIRIRVNKYIGFGIIILISILTGIGIYIGRFLRFNSWDIIFRPISLIRGIFDSLDSFSFLFVSIFSLFMILVFGLYNYIKDARR